MKRGNHLSKLLAEITVQNDDIRTECMCVIAFSRYHCVPVGTVVAIFPVFVFFLFFSFRIVAGYDPE